MSAAGREIDYARERLYIRGIPVWGQEAIRTSDGERFVASLTSHEEKTPPREFGIGEVAAIEAAKAALEWPEARVGLVDRWYKADGDGVLQPVWRVVLERSFSQLRRVLVDGVEGRVLETFELTNRQAAQRGLAIPTNPVFSGIQDVVLPGLSGSATLTGPNIRVASYYPVAFLNQPESVLLTPQAQLARANAQGHFYYQSSDPRFSEVQVYYGAARAADYIRGLGFSGLNRQFDAIAYFFNAENPYDVNAFFTPTAFNNRGAIVLQVNRLGADTAFDSDVIFHEYGHATVHAIVDTFQSSKTFRAVNEAYADYFAASYFDSAAIGEYFPYLSPTPNVLTRQEFLRNIDNNTRYPDDVKGREHQDSLMFSGALWQTRQTLGRQRGDAVAINGLARMSASNGFYTAANAVVSAARSLYGGAIGDTVAGIFTARGLLSDAARFAELAIDTVSGAVRNGSITANRPGGVLLAADDFRITVPSRSRGLRVEAEATSRTNPISVYVRFRAPVEIRDGQIIADYVFAGSGAEPGYVNSTITLNSLPELQMGDYYVVVGNRSGGPLNYGVRLTVEQDPSGQNSFAPALASGQTASGAVPFNFLNSRQFRVEVPPGTTGMEIQLDGDRDVDLYVNFGTQVVPGGEGLPLAEGVSNSPQNSERILLTGGTVPNLRPGTYFIAVENYDRAGVARFSLRVNFRAEAAYAPNIDAVGLGESRSLFLPASTNTATLLSRQFRIDTQLAWTGLQLETSSNSVVTMLVRRARAITFENGIPQFETSTLINNDTQRITFDANSTPPYQPTVYYVAFLSFSETGGSLNFRYTPLPLAAGSGPRVNAVVDGASFAGRISPGSWITIAGENLARTTRLWGGADFVNGRLPTSIDGVGVMVGGVAAWVYYVSPGQLNVLVPQNLRSGTQDVVVTVDGLRSTAFTTVVQAATPGLFRFDPAGRRYAAAVFASGEFAGPAGLFGAALTTRAVRRGEVVQLFATGLGNVNTQDGIVNEALADITSRTRVTIGGLNARIIFAGRTGPGLYQINVEAPSGAAVGENEVRVTVDGFTSPGGVFLVVQ
jgi:uncharacterized protein (TIGR03437 family)